MPWTTSVADLFRGGSVISALFVANVAMSMSFSAIPDLVMQMTCSPNGQPEDIDYICNNTFLVADATAVTATRSALRSVLSAVCIPIFAPWRDHTGHSKPLIVVGMVAEMIGGLCFLFAAMDWSISTWVPSMVEASVGGLFGESICYLGGKCLVIQRSTSENRTLRLQFYMAAMFLATCIASTAYGFILTRVGYVRFFTIVTALQIVAIFCAVVFIKEEDKTTCVRRKKVYKEIRAIFKKRPNATVIWLMLVCGAIVSTYFSAEKAILIYYLQQGRHFSIPEEGMYDAYDSLIAAIGSLIFPFLFTRVLNISDFKIGIFSAMLTAVCSIFLAFVVNTSQLYIFSLLGVLKSVLYSMPETIVSKCVEDDELGKFLGFGSIIESFLPFTVNHLYSSAFSSTSDTVPGLFYLLSATADYIALVLFSICSCLYVEPKSVSDDTEASRKNSKEDKIWVICRFRK